LVCVGVVVGIVIVLDCGVYACCCKKKGKKKGKGKTEKIRKKKKKKFQHKEMKTSDVEDSNAPQPKTSGVKKTNILPAPMVGGTSMPLEEEPGKGKKGRGVTKKVRTKIVKL